MSLSRSIPFGAKSVFKTPMINDGLNRISRSTAFSERPFTKCSLPNLGHVRNDDKFNQILQKGFQDAADMYKASFEVPGKYFKNKPSLSLLCSYYCGLKHDSNIDTNNDLEDIYMKKDNFDDLSLNF